MRWICCLLLLTGCATDDPPADSPADVSIAADSDTVRPEEAIWLTDATGLLGLSAARAWGVSMADYTGDGWPDVTLATLGGIQMYRNRGDGTFEPDGSRSGIAADDLKTVVGVAYGDLDGDGDLDMMAATIDSYDRLYWNDSTGVFTNGTQAAGIAARQARSQGISFGDLDGDGDLDVFVGTLPARIEDGFSDITSAMEHGQNIAWRNNGDGSFTDVALEWGLGGPDTSYTFGALIVDIDGDGDQDVMAVHDFDKDELLINDGDGLFVDQGSIWLGDHSTGLMGLDVGDVDRDGQLDVYATDWHTDRVLTRGLPNADHTLENVLPRMLGMGVNNSAVTTGWGCALIDLDNDGDQDVITTSAFTDGFGVREETVQRTGRLVVMENHDLGVKAGAMRDITAEAGPDLEAPLNGFGLATADFDRDGDLDVLIGVEREVLQDGQAVQNVRKVSLLLENHGKRASDNASVQLELSQPGPNVFAVGARIDVRVDGRWTSRVILGGASYLSAQGPWAHFGLGTQAGAELIRVTWPDGEVTRYVGWSNGVHTLERPMNGDCCPSNGPCFDAAEEACLSQAATVAPDFCKTMCEALAPCEEIAEIGLTPGDVPGCVAACEEEPLEAFAQACFSRANDCAGRIACLED